MTKSPNPTDRHVGARIRMRRISLGFSQEKLGEALGITFQQIQKYEKGTNRIGASRLQDAAKVLAVPVNFFFDGTPADSAPLTGFAESPSALYRDDFANSEEGTRLIAAFLKVNDPQLRRKIIELIEAMAMGNGG